MRNDWHICARCAAEQPETPPLARHCQGGNTLGARPRRSGGGQTAAGRKIIRRKGTMRVSGEGGRRILNSSRNILELQSGRTP